MSDSDLDKKWPNINIRRCHALAEIMDKLQAAVGELPEGMTRKSPELRKAGELLNYGEKLLRDDNFWQTVPEILRPSEEEFQELASRVDTIRKFMEEPKDLSEDVQRIADRAQEFSGGTTNELLMEATLGTTREKLREELRSILASSSGKKTFK